MSLHDSARSTVLLAALCATLVGCASAPLTLPPPPLAAELAPASRLPVTVAASGLRVVSDATAPGHFMAGLLFRGGPINDPPNLPGLTEWVVDAALLGTQGRDPATESPHQRALRLGGTIEPVATGAFVGWLIAGPTEQSETLLELLFEVAIRPSFPATRTSMAITRNREGLETKGDSVVERAIAIALGQAIGLRRPLYMGPTKGMFERVTLAHTERHWRRIIQPKWGALVILGDDAPDTETLAALQNGWRDEPANPLPAPAICAPQGRSAHLLVTPGSFGAHTIALWGGRAPGLGEPDRRAAQALMVHLDERAGGPVESLVGASQARRSSPDIIDLGHIAGKPIAATLVGAAGPAERALEDLERMDQFLSGLGGAKAITTADATEAHRRLRGADRLRLHRPFHGVLQRATQALSGSQTDSVTSVEMNAVASRLFAPWRSSLVWVGSMDLRETLARRAAVAIWSENEEDPPPKTQVRCVPPAFTP